MTGLTQLAITFIGFMGIVATFQAIREFNLVYWKRSLYYIFIGLVIFEIYQIVLTFQLVEAVWIISIIEIEFILFITYGIHRIRKTAEKVGA
jgi:signal transduction histidine kinase